MEYNLITVLGPTASGKTKLAVKIADYLSSEIISADSRQVYRGMDLGTGKDLDDFYIKGKETPCHLIDICEPTEEYNLFRFHNDFFSSFEEITSQKKTPILCGGTGLYLSSVLQDYTLAYKDESPETISHLENTSIEELIKELITLRPDLHNSTDTLNEYRVKEAIKIEYGKLKNVDLPVRPKINSIVFGTEVSREERLDRIKSRLKQRFDDGMVEEVRQLLDEGVTHERLRLFGLEYKFISMYVAEELNYNDMFQKLYSGICDFSKRQMTWFRKMEREGVEINWVKPDDFTKVKEVLKNAGL